MRIAMLLDYYRPAYTGAGYQAERLIRELIGLGIDVEVLAPLPQDSDAPRRERSGRLSILRFPIPRSDDDRKFVLGLRAAWWLLTRSGWDVLHLHGFNYWAILPSLVARLRRRPVLVKTTIALGTPQRLFGIPQRLITATFRRCDAIVALSGAIEQDLRRDERCRARILRIANGADGDAFHPRTRDERLAARERLGLPSDAFIVVAVGQLNERKNVVGLLEAAGRLSHRPVCVVLAGPPSDFPEVRERVDRAIAALPDGVDARKLGHLPAERIPEILGAADVFVLNSRSEGMPNSLLEGMATGLACVSTDIPGSRDVLADGGGVMVPVDDPDALARELERLAADPDERSRLGAEARRVIGRSFSIAAVARRYAETYAELLAER
jgi:glycosyltransferase involved in cell wall biosynthesis